MRFGAGLAAGEPATATVLDTYLVTTLKQAGCILFTGTAWPRNAPCGASSSCLWPVMASSLETRQTRSYNGELRDSTTAWQGVICPLRRANTECHSVCARADSCRPQLDQTLNECSQSPVCCVVNDMLPRRCAMSEDSNWSAGEFKQ